MTSCLPLREIFLPSTLPKFKEQDKKYREQGRIVEDELRNEKEHVLQLLEQLKDDRKALSEAPVTPAAYAESVNTYQILKTHLDSLNARLSDVKEKFRTSACRDSSEYYGISDWAEKSLRKYAFLCDAISGASIFGAGITYTTIFSAAQGHIAWMCWSFALFDISFIIALLVRSLLMWASQLPLLQKHFATTMYWDLAIRFAMFLAFSSVTVAIFLLNMTIFRLASQMPTVGTLVAPSAILSISVLAGAIFTILVFACLHFWAKSFSPKNDGKGFHRKVGNNTRTAELFV